MPKGKNCPNCGAVYEMDKNKCPYCGTSYYDMSAINFEDSEPFYLKIKTKINGELMYITQLVIPKLGSFNLETDNVCARDTGGNILATFTRNQIMTTNIQFTAIPENGNLILIEKGQEE